MEGTFKSAAGIFKGIVATATVSAAVAGINQIIGRATAAAGQFEQMSVSFKTLTGNITQAKNLLGDLEQISVSTPFAPDTIVQAGRTLLAFGVEATKVGDVIRSIGEASAATGADLNNLAYIFGQARATGVLFTQDLNQLANAGLPVLSLLAEEMDEAEGNIRKLASEGKVTFDILERAFERASKEGGRFHGALEEQAQTLEGLKSTAEGLREQFFRTFGQRLLRPAKEFQRLMIGIWEAARDYVAVPLDQELRKEQRELNFLVEKLTDANISQETRNDLIQELQNKYPDFLQNIDTEELKTDDLRIRLSEVNEQYVARIALAEAAKIVEEEQERVDAKTIKSQRLLNEATNQYLEALNDETLALDRAQKADIQKRGTITDRIAALLDLANAIQNAENRDVDGDRNRQRAAQEIQISLNNLLSLSAEALTEAEKRQQDLNQATQVYQERQKDLQALLPTASKSTETQAESTGKLTKETKKATDQTYLFVESLSILDQGLFSGPGDAPIAGLTPFVRAIIAAREEISKLALEDRSDFIEVLGLFGDVPPPEEDPFVKAADARREAIGLFVDESLKALELEQERTDQLIRAQEDRVEAARRIAERGNAEQLQLEEDRLDQLLEKREEFARRERAIAAIQVLSAQSVAAAKAIEAIAEGFSGPGGVVQGIATGIALAAAVASIGLTISNAFGSIQSFDKGTENLFADKANDSALILAHKGERILTKGQNAKIPGSVKNEDVPSLINFALKTQAGQIDPAYIAASSGRDTELLKGLTDRLDALIDVTYSKDMSVNIGDRLISGALLRHQSMLNKQRQLLR